MLICESHFGLMLLEKVMNMIYCWRFYLEFCQKQNDTFMISIKTQNDTYLYQVKSPSSSFHNLLSYFKMQSPPSLQF